MNDICLRSPHLSHMCTLSELTQRNSEMMLRSSSLAGEEERGEDAYRDMGLGEPSRSAYDVLPVKTNVLWCPQFGRALHREWVDRPLSASKLASRASPSG